jgi:hypothetical protein
MLNVVMLNATNKPFILNVIVLGVVMLNVVILNVVMLDVLAALCRQQINANPSQPPTHLL